MVLFRFIDTLHVYRDCNSLLLLWKNLLPVSEESSVRGSVLSSSPYVFLWKGVLKICSKFTKEHPCQSAISIKLQSNFIKITLCYGCSHVNLQIFRTPFPRNIYAGLFLNSRWSYSDQCQTFNPLPTNVYHYIETSQLICNANQLTG